MRKAVVVGVGIPVSHEKAKLEGKRGMAAPKGKRTLPDKMQQTSQGTSRVGKPSVVDKTAAKPIQASPARGVMPRSGAGTASSSGNDDLKRRLEELRRLRATIELKWDTAIAEKQEEKRIAVDAKVTEKARKIEQLREQFCPQQHSIDPQIAKMKEQAEAMKAAGRHDEADKLLAQVRHANVGSLGNAEFTQARELQARMTELERVCDRAITAVTERFDTDITKMQKLKMKELKPIDDQIRQIERKLKMAHS